MAKLWYKWGCMGAGKSLELIRTYYNYTQKDMDVLVYKPRVDDRDGTSQCWITSRAGDKIRGTWIDEFENIMITVHREIEIKERNIRAVFIDEGQFLSDKQVKQLLDVTLTLGIPVLVYGLKTDFQSHLFPGSQRLFELADDIEEIRSVCWCGSRATQNARVCGEEVIRHGEQVMTGGDESYIALCTKHFMEGKLK